MGGIAGIVSFTRSRADIQKVERLLDLLGHRGPDDRGTKRSANGRSVLGGCRQLVEDADAQIAIPLVNETQDVWAVLDGDIDNHRALRHSLHLDGHAFRSEAAGEVVVHAYEQYGMAFLDHLHGRFALAIWDDHRGRLILARDRLGERPLYWGRSEGLLAFASEGKVLLDVLPIPRRIDLDGLGEYLAHGFVQAPNTMFEGIRKIGPGEALVVERGNRIQPLVWWSPCRDERRAAIVRSLPSESHENNLRILLDSAVADRLAAHQPVAAVLDGQLESLAIAIAMRRLLGRPVEALALGDDMAHRLAGPAAAAGVRVTIVSGAEDPKAAYLPDVVRAMDEPLANPEAFGLWWLARSMAKTGLVLGLTSLGASQLLVGSDLLARHRPIPSALRLLRALPPVGQRVGRRLLNGLWRVFRADTGALNRAIEAPPPGPAALFDPSEVLRPEAARRRMATDLAARHRRGMPAWLSNDQLGALSFIESRTAMPESSLMTLDRMSAAHSVAMRLPFLDDAVVDYVLAVPSAERAAAGRPKDLLMRALNNRMLAAGERISDYPRSKRPAGPLPADHAALFADAVQHGGLFRHGVLDRQYCQDLLRQHQSELADHSRQMWSLLVLSEWFDLHGLDIPGEVTANQPNQAAVG